MPLKLPVYRLYPLFLQKFICSGKISASPKAVVGRERKYKLLNKTPPVITSAKVIDVDHVNETFSVVVEAESNTKIKSIKIPV